MSYLNIPPSSTNRFIAQIVGKARGDINLKVTRELSRILSTLEDKCPSTEEAAQIQVRLNNLRELVQSVKIKINSLNRLENRLSPLVQPLATSITFLKNIPIPAQFTPIGTINTYSDTLTTLKELKKQLTDQVSFLDSANTTLQQQISTADLTIERLDTILQSCIEGESLQNIQDIPSDTSVDENYFYRGYKLEITVVEPDRIAPKRQAIAKDSLGIIRFSGDSSYSSSVDILLRELKFLIDRELS